MAEDELANTDNPDKRRRALAKSLADLELTPVGPDKVELTRADAVKLPLGELTSLGVGLSSLSKAGEQLYRVKLPAGATLKQAKDGLFSSSATLLDGSSAWAKFERVAPGLAFDPTAVAVAAALAQINQKLDGIQDSIDRMFGYLRAKDKAADLAALDNLKAITNIATTWTTRSSSASSSPLFRTSTATRKSASASCRLTSPRPAARRGCLSCADRRQTRQRPPLMTSRTTSSPSTCTRSPRSLGSCSLRTTTRVTSR